MIYLDHNATTPPALAVIEAMQQCLAKSWGNPSSPHAFGQQAKRLLNESRASIAKLLGAKAAEVVLTSGATEANQTVLHGASVYEAQAQRPPLIVLSAIEHAAMLRAAQNLANAGRIRLQLLPVNRGGQVDLEVAHSMITSEVVMVSVMAANNETGVIQPVAEIAQMARAAGALMHVDATQVAGRVPCNFAELAIDFMSISAHKFYGPKGVGALLIRKGLEWPALLDGSQERGRRGGTENLPAIVGAGVAASLALQGMADEAVRIEALRTCLEQRLIASLPVRVFGGEQQRLPNTVSFRIAQCDADWVLNRLERAGIIAASGSACSAGGTQPSHVLLAMGVDAGEARGAVRFSLGKDTNVAHIDATVSCLVEAFSQQKAA